MRVFKREQGSLTFCVAGYERIKGAVERSDISFKVFDQRRVFSWVVDVVCANERIRASSV